jgi:hypothetical protein
MHVEVGKMGNTGKQMTSELPFSDAIVTVALSDQQQAQLLPLVSRQAIHRKGLLFLSVAPFWSVEEQQTQLRLQATFLPWKTANKILKLIREDAQTA